MDGATLKPPVFQTPPRILIPKLVTSRDAWKGKATERKKRLKAARIRIRDLGNSRDHWKAQAQVAGQRLAELERQLEQAQQDLAAARAENDQWRAELKKK
jgi:predicted  nucleic acid-binding Zn-ribbon protein